MKDTLYFFCALVNLYFPFGSLTFCPIFLLVVLFDHSMQKPDTKMGTKATQVKVAKQFLSKKTATFYNKKKVGKCTVHTPRNYFLQVITTIMFRSSHIFIPCFFLVVWSL